MDRSDSRDEIRSFLIGTLLGDCHVSSTGQWQWSNTTRDWVEWKAAFIRKNLGFSCTVHKSVDLSCKNGSMFRFAACSQTGRLKIYSNWFYDKNHVKRITKKIRHLNHPLGLLALILDQGSCKGGLTRDSRTGNMYYRKPTIRIHLNKHTKDELQLFQEAVKANFSLNSSLHQKNSKYLDVYFNTKDSQVLWSLISDLVPTIPTALKKFDPFICQTTNAKLIKRNRGVKIV
jgi:hypothetical protein